ncbi:rho GTPase-activating protein 21 isoform X2 [Echeneis naucrates]|uniref:rho GTPase-activating protein 21 isoform X2 n=1 Tax=Echeneis naucrates TaxID=173247 RepID=UPI00111343CE|nr:rho GTPase-activating protein 21-like isoform X2 [Echeneis naucrates]
MNEVAFCLVGIPPHSDAQAKGWRDGMVSSYENRHRPLSSGEVEGISWQGPRTILLRKNSQGFGFTLRHFIVYPPESSFHSLRDKENGNAAATAGFQRSHLEPMDTIFVKSVKENGPAQQAGLSTGDRLVKVNGENILGKTYSQVIGLIQKSENILELSIMPKDEDVLQLVSAYSQDAYLKDNKPYSDGAQSLPEPPLLSSTSTKPTSTLPSAHSLLDNHQSQSGTSISPLDDHPSVASTPTSGWPGPEDSGHFTLLGKQRGSCSLAISAFDFHFANHNAAIASATLPPLRKSSLPASTRTHADALCHQALSDWYYSQAEAAEHMSPCHRSISQDHLAELGLRLALGPGPASATTASSEQCRRETFKRHHQAAAASHDSYWIAGWGGVAGPESRSCSESLLAAYAEYEHNYGRSVETLAQATALVSQHYEYTSPSSHITKLSKQTNLKVSGGHQHQNTMTPPITSTGSLSRQSGQQVAEPQTRRVKEESKTRRVKEEVLVGYKSYSHKGGHFLQQAHSFREPSYRGPHLNLCAGRKSSLADSERKAALRPQSTPALPVSEMERAPLGGKKEAIPPISLNQEVVLRKNPLTGCQTHTQALHHPHHKTHMESPKTSDFTPSSSVTPSPVPVGPGTKHRINSGLAQHAYDSLSSIPFIGSIKGRRSSYLLAITPERSKSCDEGLNAFREEGCVFSKLPKRVKSFFTDGKVGGGMRPWKRVFSVLRSNLLFLYKDKREAVLHGAGAGTSQDDHPPVSIRGCLIDIAYSETKRKHTLRLTTQDFCEYLLQAEGRDDMLTWIRVIKENSKTENEEIGFSRQALINKKLNDYRKHSLTGNKPDSSPRVHRIMPPFLLAKTDNSSINRTSRADDNKVLWGINIMKKTKKTGSPKAFGVRLEDCQPAINHKFVPLIVEMCCGVVEATGLEYIGIYRVPGNNAMVSNLQEHLNKGMGINTAEERWQDLNVISSLLKAFFRKLPEPLFTDDKYSDFIDANRVEDAEDRLKTMKKLIHDLPDHYYHTLQFLVGHLKRVADHSEKNKMEPRNLALVFGPTLVRTSEDNMTDMVTHMPDRYKIVETLILHYDWFFSDGELVKEEKGPVDKQEMQHVPNIDHLLSNIGRPGMPGEASDSTTSDSLKSKHSAGSKKDIHARDFLPKSIISAVTRKRKKCLSTYLPGSSADEDSEHEPVKASNYGGGEGRVGEKEEDRREEEVFKEQHIHKPEKCKEKENGMGYGETIEKSGSLVNGGGALNVVGKGTNNGSKTFEKDTKQRTPSPDTPHQLCPNSLLCSHQQILAMYPKLSAAISSPSHLRPDNPTRGHPTVPLWIPPTLLYQASNFRTIQEPDWNQPVPVRYGRTGVGRARATSMNLDLELSRNGDRIRGGGQKEWS